MRLLTGCAAVCLALALLPSAPTVQTAHLTATTSARDAPVEPGTRTSLIVEITPKPKMHVYAPEQTTYVPVSLTLTATPAYRAHGPTFPKPEKYFFAPLKETQLVYSKPFRIAQDITLASSAVLRAQANKPGSTLTINGTLRYQACDDDICYLPLTVPVSWTLRLKTR